MGYFYWNFYLDYSERVGLLIPKLRKQARKIYGLGQEGERVYNKVTHALTRKHMKNKKHDK